MHKQLSENLHTLMSQARVTSSELAKATGLPATTIKRIRNHEQSNPTISSLLPIANYFSLTVSELLGCETAFKQNVIAGNGLQSIPLLAWDECSKYELVDYQHVQRRVPTEKPVSTKAFSLQVNITDYVGLPLGCLLIVEPKLAIESGDLIIVTSKSGDNAALKRYIKEADQEYLQSLILGIGIVPFTDHYNVVGVVVQYRVELKNNNKF